MDITLYRGDITRGADHAVIKEHRDPVEVDGKTILLVDTRFHRTHHRAALDALMDSLAVLVDRRPSRSCRSRPTTSAESPTRQHSEKVRSACADDGIDGKAILPPVASPAR